MNSENISNHSSAKDFGKFQFKPQPADAMTFFCFSLDSGRKIGHLRTCDLFSAFHSTLGKKLDIRRRYDPFFCSLLDFGWKIGHLWT